MTNTTAGYVVLAAALGMMAGLLALDVGQLTNWHDATTPVFVGGVLGHVGVVLTAFAGGKLIPTKGTP